MHSPEIADHAGRPSVALPGERFRPIQYLGNKTRLLDDIGSFMAEMTSPEERIADLFSGTAVVAGRLGTRNPVTAVDVQAYSEVLARASLIARRDDFTEFDHIRFNADVAIAVERLSQVFGDLVEREARALTELAAGNVWPMYQIIESSSPLAMASRGGETSLSAAVRAMLENDTPDLPDATATITFGGVYFSFDQALRLDALADVISRQPKKRQSVLTAALLGVASEIVNTVGKQFAQPIQLIDRAGRPKALLIRRTLRDRNLPVDDLFKRWLQRWLGSIQSDFADHRVVRAPVEQFLSTSHDCTAFYADPPYTIDHYSRFYHVLETLVLRDRPRLARMRKGGRDTVMRGLYREERHQSDYCIPSKAPAAFDKLFRATSAKAGKLLLSYSGHAAPGEQRPRLIPVDDLILMARRHFVSVSVVEPTFGGHRKLNAAHRNAATERGTERFIICRS